MKIRLNNNELVAILHAIDRDLDYNDNQMLLASLLSFVKKVNDNATSYTIYPEEFAMNIKAQIEEIMEE